MKTINKGIIFGACFTLLGLITTPEADAAFKLRLSSGADQVTITDDDVSNLPYGGGVGNANDGSAGMPGFISIIVTVGNFSITGTFGSSDPVLPNTPYQANLHLTNMSISSPGGGTITIELTDTDFTLGAPFGEATLLSSIGGTLAAGGTIEAWQVLDLQNAEFAANLDGEAVVHHGPISTPGAFASPFPLGGYLADTFNHLNTDPFSITERVVLTHTGAGVTSFDMDSLAVVPAPSALFLCLGGLPMLGAWMARRRFFGQGSN